MSIFIKKKRSNLQQQGFKNCANRMDEKIEKKKTDIANWLSRKTENYSSGTKRMALMLFCSVFAFLLILLLGSSIRGHHFGNRSLVVTHIRSVVPGPVAFPLNDSLIEKVEKTKIWLDSLRSHDTSKLKAILLARPFLQENLQLLENIYQSQRTQP